MSEPRAKFRGRADGGLAERSEQNRIDRGRMAEQIARLKGQAARTGGERVPERRVVPIAWGGGAQRLGVDCRRQALEDHDLIGANLLEERLEAIESSARVCR
jgi:hypothetical protein